MCPVSFMFLFQCVKVSKYIETVHKHQFKFKLNLNLNLFISFTLDSQQNLTGVLKHLHTTV